VGTIPAQVPKVTSDSALSSEVGAGEAASVPMYPESNSQYQKI
jgi:hypothetical protein